MLVIVAFCPGEFCLLKAIEYSKFTHYDYCSVVF
jgi:hypothetical protein